jgi:hypothetical protein
VVFSATALSDTTHTVRFEWTGSKNASSTGTVIGLDRADSIGTLLQATDASVSYTRLEENHAVISYNGTWTASANPARSAGAWLFASANATATFNFTGDRFNLIASKGPGYGIATVIVDGTQYPADLYSASYLHQAKVLEVKGLASDTHTVKILWTGAANPLSSGNAVGIDAIDIVGTAGP